MRLGGLEGWKGCVLVFLQSEDKSGLPTAQQAERKRKEKRGLPGVRRAVRSQVPGERGKLGEVGEWQCEVRWGARRVVARREQGAVGNVSRREWGDFERSVITNSILEEKEGEISESASYIGEHLNSCPPAARNQPSWVLILR